MPIQCSFKTCLSNASCQPIALRIHEHCTLNRLPRSVFFLLFFLSPHFRNEKIMFYIRIAHNKRLRDVNIVCSKAYFVLQKQSAGALLLRTRAALIVHCKSELIMFVCVILNRFSFSKMHVVFVPFLPIRLSRDTRVCSVCCVFFSLSVCVRCSTLNLRHIY